MLRSVRDVLLRPHGGGRVHPENSDEVVRDPRFGLLSLRKYTGGESCTQKVFLPLLIISLQWTLFFCILLQPRDICPRGIAKVSFVAICLLYTTRIPHLWDQYKDGRDLARRTPPSWASLLDVLHEHGLKISVFLTNLLLVGGEEPLDQVLNCVALEFLSEIDNLYQIQLLERAQIKEHIYKDFITPAEAQELVQKSSLPFRIAYTLTGYFLSLFALLILLLYPFLLLLLLWGALCT